ncbi:MAG: hypothetical protein R6X25_15750 [Candidatus Krumholzibacteriia bacterium]
MCPDRAFDTDRGGPDDDGAGQGQGAGRDVPRRARDRRPADPQADDLRLRADRICALILSSDYPDVDLDVAIAALRRWVREHLPEHEELFEMVYASRFRRLREQWR